MMSNVSRNPVVAIRALHVDLKGVPPTFNRLLKLLDLCKSVGYNAMLVEWEDMFPWAIEPAFRCETAFTARQVIEFHEAAAARGIEIIPLIQCIGHMEMPLSVPRYVHMREVPYRADVLNPLAEGAPQLVQGMIDEIVALTHGIRYFHLGGDEAWTLGSHPQTRAFIERHGDAELYLQFVEPMLRSLNQRGIRPILWHDMMRQWPTAQLERLAAQADLMVWAYAGHPHFQQDHCNRQIIERFADAGFQLWGASAFKGADYGGDADLPDYAARQQNVQGWIETLRQGKFVGAAATGWSRFSGHRTQTTPIDGALDTLVMSGIAFRDGTAMDQAQAAAWLDNDGEGEIHTRCRAVLQQMQKARIEGWEWIRFLRGELAMQEIDHRRRGVAHLLILLELLKKSVTEMKAAGAEMHQTFAGLIEPLWIERYLFERVAPLERERDALRQELLRVDPNSISDIVLR